MLGHFVKTILPKGSTLKDAIRAYLHWENMREHAAVVEGKAGTSVLPQEFNITHCGSLGLVSSQAK